jgi:hypothetical protein
MRVTLRILVAGLVTYLTTAGMSLILAMILVFVAITALATALGGTSLGSMPSQSATAQQLSVSDLETLLRTLISFTGYTFFASHITPIEASALGGATYGVIGIGSATITLFAILLPFVLARRTERTTPSPSTTAAAARGFAIAVPYWVGALALYLASFISVGTSQLGVSIHPSGLALLIPAVLVGVGGALGAASIRPPVDSLPKSVVAGLARASIAIVVGIVATVLIVVVVYAVQSATGASSPSTTGSIPSSPAARDLGWGLLALVPFYIFNAAGVIWSAALGGLLFKDTVWSVVVLLGPAFGALAGATQLRRSPDRFEQASFALGFGAGTWLIALVTTPAIINGPSALPAPVPAVLVALAFGAVAGFLGPYLLSVPPIHTIAASRPMGWIVRPVLAMWPADVRVESSTIQMDDRLSLPGFGRVQAISAGLLIVLIAAGVLANSQLSSRFSPEHAVLDYLNAQTRGDADAMWSIAAYESASGTGGELLSKAALAKMLTDPANTAISSVRITDTVRADDSNYTVTAQMKRGGQDLTLSIHVRKDSSRSNWLLYPAWRVVIPATTIAITAYTHAGVVKVDGFTSNMTTASASVEVIPGHHEVSLEPTDIFAGESQPVDATTDASVTFKATLNAAASTAVDKAISDLFSRCAATHQISPSACPNSSYAAGNHQSNVKWTLVGDPTSSMQLAIGDQLDTITASGQWKMHLSYTYWYDFDPTYLESWDQDVSGYFDDTLHWNGSGFDITSQSGY